MAFDIVQISNVLNNITQLHPNFKFYHFGWRSDIEKDIDNNFDNDTATGRFFPSVQWVPPSQEVLEDLHNNRRTIKMELFFDDLQGYTSTGEIDTRTMIEVFRDLKRGATIFLNNFSRFLTNIYLDQAFVDTDKPINFFYDSNAGQAKRIFLKVDFSLTYFEHCESLILDPANLPVDPSSISPVETYDYEDYKNINDSRPIYPT